MFFRAFGFPTNSVHRIHINICKRPFYRLCFKFFYEYFGTKESVFDLLVVYARFTKRRLYFIVQERTSTTNTHLLKILINNAI